jgi:hypothetical protein
MGPFHLDDLMVALQAALFEKQDLGMTIDPDPANPHGPQMVVRYFGGCENTAFGWVMFECDRLLKCYSQGQDNFTRAALRPEVPDFYNMLERYLAAGQGRDASQWNRFWLSQDIHDKPRGEQPKSSNGTQPVALVAHEGQSLSLIHCRVYLRTQAMVMRNGKLEEAKGKKDQQSEQFAVHFCNHYADFARAEPAFAQLAALCRLISLADWIVQNRIPLDTELIRTYRQQIPVITPTRTPAHTASLKYPAGELQIYGGVDFGSRTFYGQDDGRAARLADPARTSEPQHRDEISWTIKTSGDPLAVVAVPTLPTQFKSNPQRKKKGIEFRPPGDDNQRPDGMLPPEPPNLAESDRRVLVSREPASLARIQFVREQQARAPPDESSPQDGLPVFDGSWSADSDRSTKMTREYIPLVTYLGITSNQQLPRPPPAGPPSTSPSAALAASGFQPESDRTSQFLTRLDSPLVSGPQRNEDIARGPPLLAVSERQLLVAREPIPLRTPEAASALGQEVFETADGQKTWNMPQMEQWNNPRSEQRANVQGVAGTEIRVADRLTLVSELGDIMVPFGSPVVDQQRAIMYYPTEPAGQHGIRGYYPQAGVLEFGDGMKLHFDSGGLLEQVSRRDGTSIRFRYQSRRDDSALRPIVESCEVVSTTGAARSGVYDLLDRGKTQPPVESSPKPVVPPASTPAAAEVASVSRPRETIEYSFMPETRGDTSTLRLETNPSTQRALLVRLSVPAVGSQQLAGAVRFASPDAAYTWRAALRSANVAESAIDSSTIVLRTPDGQPLEVRLSRQEGAAAAGESVELPLLVASATSSTEALPAEANVYVDVDVQWQTRDGVKSRRVSLPVRLVAQSRGNLMPLAMFVGLAGALGLGIWRIFAGRKAS